MMYKVIDRKLYEKVDGEWVESDGELARAFNLAVELNSEEYDLLTKFLSMYRR